MSDGLVRVGIGTRFVYDGELAEVTEMHAAAAGTEVVLRSSSGQGSVLRVALRELPRLRQGLDADRFRQRKRKLHGAWSPTAGTRVLAGKHIGRQRFSTRRRTW